MRNAQTQEDKTSDPPIDVQEDNIDADEVQTTAEKNENLPREYEVYHIPNHVCNGPNGKFLVHWYAYAPADYMVRTSVPIPDYFVTR